MIGLGFRGLGFVGLGVWGFRGSGPRVDGFGGLGFAWTPNNWAPCYDFFMLDALKRLADLGLRRLGYGLGGERLRAPWWIAHPGNRSRHPSLR